MELDLDEEASLAVGSVLAGRIRLDQLLGHGASGQVFKGYHVTLAKYVAVKVLKHRPSASALAAFLNEARAASRLDHPNTIRVLDFGEDEPTGLPYLVMEYVSGRSLAAIIGDQPLEWRRGVLLLLQTADALAEAHSRGIVHQDLKPQNVMVCEVDSTGGELEEKVKLCDFGLARVMEESITPETGELPEGDLERLEDLTVCGPVRGTPAYMAPEQALGRPTDSRSDVYSLGVMAYRMLSGRRPIGSATNMSQLRAALARREWPRLSELVPEIPAAVVEVIDRAMSLEPSRRFAHAGEFAAALRASIAVPAVEVERPRALWPLAFAGIAAAVAGIALGLRASTPVVPAPMSPVVLTATVAAPPVTVAPELPKEISLEIAGIPKGCEVRGPGGALLRMGPGSVPLARGELPVTLKLATPGRATLERTIVPDRDQRLEVAMPVPASTAPPTRKDDRNKLEDPFK